MAHESFENKQIAALLNKYFVCIKVDREQRPDIDSVYMSATQLINGQGGWPMTVFLDLQLRPFHAATYYPPFSTGKNLGLEDVLLKIQDLWIKQAAEINRVATAVTLRIKVMADDTLEQASLLDNIHTLALQQISNVYDEDSGGFSAAPKFPRPRNEFTNLNIFYIDEVFRNKDLSPQQIKWLASASKKLNAIRRLRPSSCL